MQATILEQCPGMPISLAGITLDNYKEYGDRIVAELGPIVRIRKGSGFTALLPTDGLPEGKPVILVDTSKE